MSLRHAVIAALMCLAAAPAGASAAPAIFPSKGCYVINQPTAGDSQVEPMTITGTGFAPGAVVEFIIDGQRPQNRFLTADASGGFTATGVQPPWIRGGERAFSIVAQEQANPGQRAEARTRVTVFGITTSHQSTRPTGRVTYIARGWTNPLADPTSAMATADVLYAHYRFGGRRVKDVRLGRVTGPCGTLRTRVRQLPVDKPKIGTYRVQFDLSPRYRSRTSPFVALDITVAQKPKQPRPVPGGGSTGGSGG